MSVAPPAGRSPRPAATRAHRRWIRALAVAAIVVAAGYALWRGLPPPAELVGALRSARGGWLALATLAEAVSIGMFARQQRRLLTAFGVPVSLRRSLALAYARSAIAVIAPAGGALSAGYAFRQFRTRGASAQVAMAATTVCGVLSLTGLVLLYAVGAVPLAAVGPARYPVSGSWPAATAAVLAAAVVIGIVAVVARRRRWPYPAAVRRLATAVAGLGPVRGTLAAVTALPRRDWLAALAFAAASWLSDLACLLASAHAFTLPLSPAALAVGYLTVQLVRQVPATPGGVGVVEASLLIVLVSTGAPRGPAAAAVLVYRLLSCWAVLPVGLAAWAALRPGRPAPDPGDRELELAGQHSLRGEKS
ncbi:flippase-like domain-containing protein [Planosporangium thailandense]|uniref:Flippase-like domain-containing protein n=1 Tax=Planosporangium thailandense TaxID=765197 RepID=A0ABX0XT28_9ACTN|nr:lysylphosphatidylglycerol synthase transmembrane domain-containing protein [Planosporangium thailandense]NJC68605.1 flippase-like domain-containing protein [Planosporangium thailandense]